MMNFLWIVLVVINCFLLKEINAVDSLRFFVIGDMGGIDYEPYSTYFERSTAKEMGKLARQYSPQFILELGDNFYWDGVTDVDDKRFYTTFENVYNDSSLHIPWYVIAGNHDHNGNVSAQIEYSKRSKRWNFPSKYYYKEFTIGSVTQSLGIVFIDTIDLCGNSHDLRREEPDGIIDQKAAEDQWKFIKHSLRDSDADYLFTAGHYPVYSIAEHGPTKCLVKGLEPYLTKYNANGHMSGHDHNLQHLRVKKEDGDYLEYFVSGMANFVDPSDEHRDSVPEGSSKFFNADYATKGGFLYAEATKENMTFTFIDANGRRLYSTVVLPRKQAKSLYFSAEH